jgi:hypothetical protein
MTTITIVGKCHSRIIDCFLHDYEAPALITIPTEAQGDVDCKGRRGLIHAWIFQDHTSVCRRRLTGSGNTCLRRRSLQGRFEKSTKPWRAPTLMDKLRKDFVQCSSGPVGRLVHHRDRLLRSNIPPCVSSSQKSTCRRYLLYSITVSE